MLIISDLHWRCDTPSWRKEEDYAAQVLRPQLGALLDMGEPVLVAGDVFHRAADFPATYDLLTFLLERNAFIYATRGQHDMLLHNLSMESTGFNMLASVGRIVPLDSTPTFIGGWPVYGMGWGEEVPDSDGGILIAHVPVSHNTAPYKGATSAEAFRDKTLDYKYAFTGDNHRRFMTTGIYNAGCFHQMTEDLADQPPVAWRVTHDGVKMVEIPFAPPMVDACYAARKDKGKAGAAGAEFVKALADARTQGTGDIFMQALRAAAAESEGETKALLNEVVRKCEEVHT